MKISLFYENVTVLDYAYLDDHHGPVGNSLIVNVELIGQTGDDGVLYDFSNAKSKVKEIIDRDCDHRLVVPRGISKTKDGKVYTDYEFGYSRSSLEYTCPEDGICEIPYSHVSYANLSSYLEEIVLKEMPKNVISVKVGLTQEESDDNACYFHYTHGLKDHYGNCQRLFHGHRSTLKVFVNGEREEEIEDSICRDTLSGNIHFAYWENVSNKNELLNSMGLKYDDILPEGRLENIPNVVLSYNSSQGSFLATINPSSVYFLNQETTVENLSIHFAELIKSSLDDRDKVSVYAFEGIGKGAIATL